jgi:hypothetical protein
MKKHPLATAWDKWLVSDTGKTAADPGVLVCKAERQYLENRLHRAFMAGAEAQEKIDKKNCKTCKDVL